MREGVSGVGGKSPKEKVKGKEEKRNQALSEGGGQRVCSGLAGAPCATRCGAVRDLQVCSRFQSELV